MTSLKVTGGKAISGTVTVSGNKNALLPMICASLLTSGKVTLSNAPALSDVKKIAHMYAAIGADVEHDADTITIQHPDQITRIEPAVLPTGIRSAVLLFAPILHRTGRFEFAQDAKGCALGVREIDPHLEVLKLFGCDIDYDGSTCVLGVDSGRGQDRIIRHFGGAV